jgi:glycosyltransferase involved in cell wall biosynthesis
MKILMITIGLRYGGKERRFLEVVKGLYFQNYQVEVILLKKKIDFPEIYQYASRVHILDLKIKKDPTVFFKIWKVFKKFSPDILHSWDSMSSIYALPIVILTRVKFLNAMIADAVRRPFGKRWISGKLTYPFSDIVLSNSFAGLKAYGVSKNKGRVIWNGYDFNRKFNLEKQDIRVKFAIDTQLVIGMVALFHERKDYLTFIKSAIILSQKYKNITFMCVGGGLTLEQHIKMVPPDLLDTRIKFTGYQHDVESIVDILDIGVLLANTKVHHEGIPNSILEYMAHGKPVVANISGGIPEIVLDGKTGFLIQPHSTGELIEKLEILINNKNLRNQFGTNGMRRVREEFNFERMISSTIDIYNDLIKDQLK